jgi:hypothetical protein
MSISGPPCREQSVMQANLIHLICGSTGAGKTTYALGLSLYTRSVWVVAI